MFLLAVLTLICNICSSCFSNLSLPSSSYTHARTHTLTPSALIPVLLLKFHQDDRLQPVGKLLFVVFWKRSLSLSCPTAAADL